MKRQRSSYADDLEDDRRRFYNRGPPPPRRRLEEYEGDEFERRKGFGSGFHEHRYRESPSPRGYGVDRAMHRSESFSGFHREFPKGFRSDRDRSRRDGGGSSEWRRPGGGWRDAEGLDGHRSRRSAVSPPSRSPSQPSRRLEGAKVEKSRKQNCSASEIEEGEVAPDPQTKCRPAAVEHRNQVELGRAKEKVTDRCELKKVDPGLRLREDLGTQGKGVSSASAAGNLGKEEGTSRGDMVAEARKVTDTRHERSASDATEKIGGGDETVSAIDQVGQSTSSSVWQDALQEEMVTRDYTANVADVVGKSASCSLPKAVTHEEKTTRDETDTAVDEIGRHTLFSMQREGMQEAVVTLDETANAIDVVWKASSSSISQEVLPEAVRDGNADVVDIIETGSSSSPLQSVMQEELPTVDSLGQVRSFPVLKEVMNEDGILLDGTANTISVVGQSNSSGVLEEAIHGKVIMQEGIGNACDIAAKSDPSAMLQEDVQGEVMTSLCQEAQEIKETSTDKKIGETIKCVVSQPEEEGFEKDGCENRVALHEMEVTEEDAAVEHKIIVKQIKHVDLEAKLVDTNVFLQSTKDHIGDSKEEDTTFNLIMGKPRPEDKGKGIAFDVLNKVENIGCESSVGRGFNLGLQPHIDQKEASNSTGTISIKQEDDTLKIGSLDLSLSLSGGLQNPAFKCSISRPDSLIHAPCSQPLPSSSSSSSSSSFCTNSDGITASISLTSAQTFVHNPNGSLTQQPLDTYEHSLGSKSLFQGVDKVCNPTTWQAQLSSNESTQKGDTTPLLQTVLQNGRLSDNTLVGVNMQTNGISNDLQRFAGIPAFSGVLSPGHSRGSHDSGLEHSRHRKQLTRERSSSSLTRGERQHGEQLILNGAGVVERVISKIVSEPLSHTGRMLKEMTGNSRTYLREAISEIIVDIDKRGQMLALQEALKRKPDLNTETLQKCPQVLLEILVAIRTGLPDFIKRSSSIATSDLVDIFLNLKCRNLSCQSVLPVFDCDCKLCQRKTGFCSSCMCIVCLKFDMASNTCSWVGCDVCLHWCHTDCGLRHSLIRKGRSGSRAYCTNEMQFHCASCGHPSEMFGFVKEVFRTCAKQWRMETLIRELQFVERIFSASDDSRGKRVRDFVKQMLIKLESKAYYPEAVKNVIAFFSDDDSNLGSGPSLPLKGIPCRIAEGIDGIPTSSRKAAWLSSVTLEGVPFLEKAGILSTAGRPSVSRKICETELQAVNGKPTIDELDGLVRLKQAEANMYQERANDARKEAESLKHVSMLKYARVEEHYATHMAKLQINELQERRKQKIEELQVIERSHHQFLSVKTRMEASIRELLLKMEATKHILGT